MLVGNLSVRLASSSQGRAYFFGTSERPFRGGLGEGSVFLPDWVMS